MRIAAKYGGFFSPLTEDMGSRFVDAVMRAPMFEPIFKPFRAILENLESSDSFRPPSDSLYNLMSPGIRADRNTARKDREGKTSGNF